MKMKAAFVLAGVALLCGACSDDTKPASDRSIPAKEAAIVDAARKDAPPKVDRAIDPDLLAWPDKQTTDYNMPLCNDLAAVRAETLSKGIKVFKGLTSTTTSVPIAEVLNNMSSYQGKMVRIEGTIIEVCPWAGCYIRLLDSSGQWMNLKVVDGTYDFRLATRAGMYAIGEGLPAPTGDHGAEVVIQSYGAMLGNILCPIPALPPKG